MVTYYDDNFGHWSDTHDPDVVAFYEQVQRESVKKECIECGKVVKIRPNYDICNNCANHIERGVGF